MTYLHIDHPKRPDKKHWISSPTVLLCLLLLFSPPAFLMSGYAKTKDPGVSVLDCSFGSSSMSWFETFKWNGQCPDSSTYKQTGWIKSDTSPDCGKPDRLSTSLQMVNCQDQHNVDHWLLEQTNSYRCPKGHLFEIIERDGDKETPKLVVITHGREVEHKLQKKAESEAKPVAVNNPLCGDKDELGIYLYKYPHWDGKNLTAVICPTCEAARSKSPVRITKEYRIAGSYGDLGQGDKQQLAIQFDEAGIKHVHSDDWVVGEYRCLYGHKFRIRHGEACPAGDYKTKCQYQVLKSKGAYCVGVDSDGNEYW